MIPGGSAIAPLTLNSGDTIMLPTETVIILAAGLHKLGLALITSVITVIIYSQSAAIIDSITDSDSFNGISGCTLHMVSGATGYDTSPWNEVEFKTLNMLKIACIMQIGLFLPCSGSRLDKNSAAF